MADPLCGEEISFPLLLPFANNINYRSRSLSPNSTTGSSTTTEYSMIGRNRQGGSTPSPGHMTPQSGGSGIVLMKTFQYAEPIYQCEQISCFEGLRSRSLEPAPFDRSTCHPMIAVSQHPLTPTIPRCISRQRQATFSAESDYETPEKIWLREQRLSAIRRTESARLTTPIHRGVSRSQSSGPRTHFDLDATPKASSSAFTEVTPKAQFGIRRRAPSMRVELRTPLCQRKRIQPMKEAETEAAILRKREGIYELEEPLMSGPSSLLQALKEVKFAEKEQLDRTPQAEPRRITLFDLIVEKERRHRVRSPPPVPPKPVRRLAATLATAAAAKATTTMKPSQRTEQSIESSVPKTVNDLKPSTLFQLSTPPSLPLPPRCAVLKKASERSNNGSKTAVITTNKPSDQGNRKERTPPLISDNLFVRWDRLKTIPLTSPQEDTKGGRSISGGEGRISPGSSGVGTEAFDDDGFITASASAITPMSVCSSPSASSVNSSSSPSVDWPHPEKITARPLSHQCSPDSIDEAHLFPKLKEVNGNADEARTITGHSPIRVSLVAAPKKSLPTSDNLPPETASDTNTITTSSSRASTIFSYPWDLPPPQAQQPSSSSSPPPPVPLKWATLQRHLLEMNHSPPHSLATPQQNGCDSRDIPERQSSVVSLESNEGPRSIAAHSETKSETMKNVEEEKTYATIGDESGAYERVLERRPSLEVPSPKLQQISAAGSIDESQKDSMPHYVYAEVRPSSDVSTSSSTKIRSPPVPAHPSKTNAMPISPEIHLYEVIRSSIPPPEAGQGSFESHSSTSISSNSTERQNPTNRSSGSASVASELGKHLEHLVYGLMKDRNSPFYKHMSTFIECTIQQLGQTPQKTLQNICQFINGVSNFLQKVHAAELRQAVEAEERDLRGLQYLDVAQELENLMQLTVLRPLHRRLIEDLQRHGCGTVPPQTAEEFTDLVKQEYRKLPNLSQEDRQRLEKTLFQPVRRIFYQMQDAFQPSDKLDCLIRIFNTINLQVQLPTNSISGQGRDAKKFVIYATILALVDLLRPSRTLDAKGDSDTSTGISRIEVQRLYLEALIAPSRLASSAEGCKCLTDLICLLRYVENFKCYTSPTETIRLIARKSQQATEIEESLCHPNLNSIRRSYTDNIQEALDRSSAYPLTFSFASPPWQERRVRKIGCSQGAEKTSIPSTPSASSSILVLAANEAERLLVPYEIPLRQSLTVRELCNMLALKLEIFDSKDYTLFYHSVSGDFLMSDTLHLERFIIQCPDASVQSVDEEMGITFSSSSSIDVLTNSQPTTPKVSPFRRFFRRQKRLISSNSLKSESPLPQSQHHQKSKGVMKRQPSIDWSTMGGRDANFVLIYRRRSSEAVLYANDLFECLPGLGKLI